MVYRVWFHPSRGDDYAKHYSSKSAASAAARKSKIAEKVVYKAKGRSLLSAEKAMPLSSKRRVARRTGLSGRFGVRMPSFRF